MMEICSAHECIPDIASLLFTFRYVQVVFHTCPVEPQSELPCEGFSIFACNLSLRLNTQVKIEAADWSSMCLYLLQDKLSQLHFQAMATELHISFNQQ